MLVIAVGKEYEARLRQQHSKLNPRTSWATREGGRGRKRRRAGYGEDSEDDECAPCFLCRMCRLPRVLSILLLSFLAGFVVRPAQGLVPFDVPGCFSLEELWLAIKTLLCNRSDGGMCQRAGRCEQCRC